MDRQDMTEATASEGDQAWVPDSTVVQVLVAVQAVAGKLFLLTGVLGSPWNDSSARLLGKQEAVLRRDEGLFLLLLGRRELAHAVFGEEGLALGGVYRLSTLVPDATLRHILGRAGDAHGGESSSSVMERRDVSLCRTGVQYLAPTHHLWLRDLACGHVLRCRAAFSVVACAGERAAADRQLCAQLSKMGRRRLILFGNEDAVW